MVCQVLTLKMIAVADVSNGNLPTHPLQIIFDWIVPIYPQNVMIMIWDYDYCKIPIQHPITDGVGRKWGTCRTVNRLMDLTRGTPPIRVHCMQLDCRNAKRQLTFQKNTRTNSHVWTQSPGRLGLLWGMLETVEQAGTDTLLLIHVPCWKTLLDYTYR